MKKFWAIMVVFMSVVVGGCEKSTDKIDMVQNNQIQDDQIYFFYYNGCPYCHYALDYMNEKYPDLKIVMVDIYKDGGFDLFKKCADKFNLGREIGTPLFCMGEHYIMGWSKGTEKQFDDYVKPFVN